MIRSARSTKQKGAVVQRSVKKYLSHLVHKFRHLQGSPASLARGTAVGVFIGIAPLLPFKSMLIVLITLATRSSTVAALLVCTFLCNPLTYIPLYYLDWLAGNLLLPGWTSWEMLQATVVRLQQVSLTEAIALVGQVGFDTGTVLLAGGCLLALPLAFCSYPLVFRFFVRLDGKRVQAPFLNAKEESPVL